jgi:hyperosmotically inducible protein
VGTEVDDAVVTSGVKAALLGDPMIKSLDFQVETRKGTVQLSGFVDDQKQIDQALTLTRGVAGVVKVENSLSVKSAPATLGSGIDDTTVTTRVKAALLQDDDIKSLDISVVTSHGEVQLAGFVGKQSQIDEAEKMARAVPGVLSVKNELMIKK